MTVSQNRVQKCDIVVPSTLVSLAIFTMFPFQPYGVSTKLPVATESLIQVVECEKPLTIEYHLARPLVAWSA